MNKKSRKLNKNHEEMSKNVGENWPKLWKKTVENWGKFEKKNGSRKLTRNNEKNVKNH